MARFYYDSSGAILGDITDYGGAPENAVGDVDTGATAPATITKYSPELGITLNLEDNPIDFFLIDISSQVLDPPRTTIQEPIGPTLAWRGCVDFASEFARALATAYEEGDTVDGHVLVAGDRGLIYLVSASDFPAVYVVQVNGPPLLDTQANTALGLDVTARSQSRLEGPLQEQGVLVKNGDLHKGAVLRDVTPESDRPSWRISHYMGSSPQGFIWLGANYAIPNLTLQPLIFDIASYDGGVPDVLGETPAPMHNITNYGISGATNVNPIVITSVGHTLITGDDVFIKDVTGVVAANGYHSAVTRIDDDNYSLDGVDGSGPAYAGGGAGQGLPTRFTVPRDGIYSIRVNLTWAANAVGLRDIRIHHNGNNIAQDIEDNPGNEQQISINAKLSKGDIIEAVPFQTSGGDLNVLGLGVHRTWFSIHWLSPPVS